MREPPEASIQARGSIERPPKQKRQLRDLWVNVWAVLRARWRFRKATYVGPRVRLWGCPVVRNDGKMIIGNHARLVSTVVPLELFAGAEGALEIGEGSFINYGCSIAATRLVRIGARCMIGTYAIMIDNDFHRVEPERRMETPPSAPIILEDNVWLGARVTVLSGVTIGSGSVIGAGSVVTKNIPSRSLAAGVPARVIRSL
jgi:acetyltransferase-like isoleucine patch superfamily enzyme